MYIVSCGCFFFSSWQILGVECSNYVRCSCCCTWDLHLIFIIIFLCVLINNNMLIGSHKKLLFMLYFLDSCHPSPFPIKEMPLLVGPWCLRLCVMHICADMRKKYLPMCVLIFPRAAFCNDDARRYMKTSFFWWCLRFGVCVGSVHIR